MRRTAAAGGQNNAEIVIVAQGAHVNTRRPHAGKDVCGVCVCVCGRRRGWGGAR